jgi:hypothetical protein
MIITIKMRCGDFIRFKTDMNFEDIAEDILNRQWSRILQTNNRKIVINRDDIKYITEHE